MGARRKGREAALKILYSLDMNRESGSESCEEILDWGKLSEDSRVFVKDLVGETVHRLEMIDELISRASLKWEIQRMAAVDRNVLRLAVSELTAGKGTPVRVVIDEAIEIAKKYGGEESGTFVNGILDRIRNDLEMES
ncbi:MAG: transcription antitermination factor NusB [Proteobacteria bacterium]|nr:transcription antitermination factor NusB [Pseudomonadota bacterium]